MTDVRSRPLRLSTAFLTGLVLSLLLASSLAAAPARGKIKVSYEPVADPDLAELVGALREESLFEDIADGVAAEFLLPYDLTVTVAACGQPNAFFVPDERQLVMCHELFALFANYLYDPEASDEENGVAIIGATVFVYLHEMGHALVHVLDLPITGKEEDAVDDLATLALIEEGDEGVASIFAALMHFAAMSEDLEEGNPDLAFWDEHSLHAQRAYGMACILYGSDPETFSDLVGEDGLPQERAARCPEEYAQKARAWDRLLEPYTAAN